MTADFNGAGCSLNPRVGKEIEFPLVPAASSKKVVVIGGGPGGMAAALYASERGHLVTLIEREPELGGAFRWASTLFPRNRLFLDYLMARISESPIELTLGAEADAAMIKRLAPDEIILAVGGRFSTPTIAGDQQSHVIRGPALLEWIGSARTAGPDDDLGIGARVVVIGANLIGIELAEFLARRGKRVHLLEPSGRLAMPAGKKRRADHCLQLDRLGVPVNTGVAVQEITKDGVILTLDSGSEKCVEAETIFVVGQPEVDEGIAEKFSTWAQKIHQIGDVSGFGLSRKAVQQAMEVAWRIGEADVYGA